MWLKYLWFRFVATLLLSANIWVFNHTDVAPHEHPRTWSEPRPGTTLRELAAAAGVTVGVAVDPKRLQEDPEFAALVAAQFGMLVPENAMKWQALQPQPGVWHWQSVEPMLEFAAAYGMAVRGHTLIWHGGLPDWLSEGDWDRVALATAMATHISTVVGAFSGRVAYWDVVNEAVSTFGGLRRTLWSKTLGPDFLEQAFRLAHQADPKAKLFYNDFRGEGLGPKADRIYRLVRDLRARGVPIHGIGLQMHGHILLPDQARLLANLQRLADLGLEIHLTEIDMAIPEPVTLSKRVKQAVQVRRLALACLAVEACTTMVFWGVDDPSSWVLRFFPGWAEPLLYDNDLEPKLAWYGLADALLHGRKGARALVAITGADAL